MNSEARHNNEDKLPWQLWVTVCLLMAFLVLAAVMLAVAKGEDPVWERRVYVFSAVQAVVFTAVGWLFGREVNRVAVGVAKKDAEQANSAVAQARAEVSRIGAQATEAKVAAAEEHSKGLAIRASVRAKVSMSETAGDGPRDVRASAGLGTGNAGANALAELSSMLDELYG